MTDPELPRVEPTGNPRVDALIDAMVCPSCRTIYNAAKAGCADPWHHDNQPPLATGGVVGPASEVLAVPDDGPGVVGVSDLVRRRTPRLMTTPEVFDGTAWVPLPDEQAAFERGVAEGRRQREREMVRDELPAQLEEARAEGRRQAAEKIAAEIRNAAAAAWTKSHWTGLNAAARIAESLVGPWGPTEQADPLAGDPVARRLGMVDADGQPLCRCLAGAPDCTHRPTEQAQDARDIESYCHRCHGPNTPWSAPSPLWNAVMRGGSIVNQDEYDGIVCPTCFALLAEERGIAQFWWLSAQRVYVELETVTPSGRTWDEATQRWRDAESTGQAPCPTCSGRSRRTVGMVCQTCGTDYAPFAEESLSLAQETFAAQAQALDPETFRRESGDTWPAEQADPLAGDPVASRLGLVDGDGKTLCRCLVGAPDCTHRLTEQAEDGAR